MVLPRCARKVVTAILASMIGASRKALAWEWAYGQRGTGSQLACRRRCDRWGLSKLGSGVVGSFSRTALALFWVAVALPIPSQAAEPDGPAALISLTEAVGISMNRLSEKSGRSAEARGGQEALVEYYSIPEPLAVGRRERPHRSSEVGDGGDREGRRLWPARVGLRVAEGERIQRQ